MPGHVQTHLAAAVPGDTRPGRAAWQLLFHARLGNATPGKARLGYVAAAAAAAAAVVPGMARRGKARPGSAAAVVVLLLLLWWLARLGLAPWLLWWCLVSCVVWIQ